MATTLHIATTANLNCDRVLSNLLFSRAVRVNSTIEDPQFLLTLLQRCPHLISLSARLAQDATPLPDYLPSNVVRNLEKFTGTLNIAKLLVSAGTRNLLEVKLEGSVTLGEALRSLSKGYSTLRLLDLSGFRWSDDAMHLAAENFPRIEVLKLDVAEDGFPKDYFQNHVVEIAASMRKLKEISIISGPSDGPPTSDQLDEQRRALLKASNWNKRLQKVAFVYDLQWDLDGHGHWIATYTCREERTLRLITCHHYDAPETSPTESLTSSTPHLPLELVSMIVGFTNGLLEESPKLSLFGDVSFTATPRHLALRNLSLTSRAFRDLAQPVLFSRVDLNEITPAILFRLQRFAELFSARPESRSWVRTLNCSWGAIEYGNPRFAYSHSRFKAAFVTFITSLPRLEMLNLEYSEIYAEIYNHFPQMQSLRSIRLIQCWGQDRGVYRLSASDIRSLRITNLDLTTLEVPANLRVDVNFTDLMLAPNLKKLSTSFLSESDLAYLTEAKSAGLSVTDLDIHNQAASRRQLVPLLKACPNLTSLRIGSKYAQPDPEGSDGIVSEMVPALKELHGALDTVADLVSGRAIEKISVRYLSGAVNKTRLQPLSLGTVPLQELHLRSIPWSTTIMDDLYSLFPDLRVLKLNFRNADSDWVSDHWVGEVRRRKTVEVLYIEANDRDGDRDNFEKQLSLLDEAKAVRPTLREVAFTMKLVWKWVGKWRVESGHWNTSTAGGEGRAEWV